MLSLPLSAFVLLLSLAPTQGRLKGRRRNEATDTENDNNHNHRNNVCGSCTIQFSNMYVFGDSFSDTGNVFLASNQTSPASPPYYNGRYSNGRNYVDFLSQKMEVDMTHANYAWGGATTDNSFIQSYSTFLNGPVPSVKDQLDQFLKDHKGGLPDPTATAYIVYASYNDYWWYAHKHSNFSFEALNTVADRVSSQVIEIAQEMVDDANAKYILVANLKEMADVPEALSQTPEVNEAYRNMTKLHNSYLSEKLDAFNLQNGETAQAVLLPIYDIFKRFRSQSDCLGFKHEKLSCLVNQTDVCADPLSHVFWDDYHPSTMTHLYLSEEVLHHLELFENEV